MPIVTLLSDFGASSPYPGEVRAVLLRASRAVVVDITHDIPRHDIACGAAVLAAAAPAFPAGTVHLAVVDPGVGTARRGLVIASGGQWFVGPDNGLLLPAAAAVGRPQALAIDTARLVREPPSATFHGRDVFAPAAAAIASGVPPEAFASPIAAPVALPVDAPSRAAGRLVGRVAYRDPFGNLVTDIPARWLDDLPQRLVVVYRGGRAPARRARTYADGRPGEVLALAGSAGTIEVALNQGDAAARLGLRAGDAVVLEARAARRARR
ncbi:MAG: SAM-dependent chlorinase/fluorinase [Armatimonadota bacterium]|nr:SAM-dependent chlorinase/fluorinase [Armatimonadota bacterium]MDR7535605.1 SAM-dependent chlorinase/fluorinase [Armatimonadota bacterium]